MDGGTKECIALLYKIVRRVGSRMRRWIRDRNDVTYVMITYDATKMDGAYSDGISSITPLFYQIFMNVQGFCIRQTPIETNDFSNTTY